MTKRVVFGAACWTLSVVFFVNQAIVQAATTRPYSLTANLISDLGITACGPFSNGGYHVGVCSPLHGFMDGTFVVVGLLQVIGAIATRRAWPLPRAYGGLILLVLAGAGLVLAGLAAENVNLSLHSNAAFFGLDFLNISMIVLGVALLPGSVAWDHHAARGDQRLGRPHHLQRLACRYPNWHRRAHRRLPFRGDGRRPRPVPSLVSRLRARPSPRNDALTRTRSR
jgi:hypothetical membrane protein